MLSLPAKQKINKERSTNSLKWWVIYLYHPSLCLGPPCSVVQMLQIGTGYPGGCFFYSVKVRGALVGDLFSESVLYHYSMKRGLHKRLMRRSGEGRGAGGQGQMSCGQKEKHIAFHQPAEKKVIHNSVDTIQLWMCTSGVRCDHAATGRQVKRRKKHHFPPGYLTAQDRITDSGGRGEGGGDGKKNPNRIYGAAAAPPGIERYSGALFTKARINSDTMVMTAAHPRAPAATALFFRHARSRFPFDSLFRSPPLSWHPNRPGGLEVSCGQSCGERLTLQD